MSKLYETTTHQGFLLYPFHHQLFLRYKREHTFQKPILLSNQYGGELSEIIYNGTLYYCFIDLSGSIVLHSLLPQAFPCHIQPISGYTFSVPKLYVFSNQLILTYEAHSHTKDIKQFTLQLPFQNNTILFQDTCSGIASPSSKGIVFEHFFYYFYPAPEDFHCIRISETFESIPITFLSHEQADAYHCLEKDWKQAKNELAKQEEKIQQLTQKLQSATKQYEELMSVAKAYRQEAIKWNQKFSL